MYLIRYQYYIWVSYTTSVLLCWPVEWKRPWLFTLSPMPSLFLNISCMQLLCCCAMQYSNELSNYFYLLLQYLHHVQAKNFQHLCWCVMQFSQDIIFLDFLFQCPYYIWVTVYSNITLLQLHFALRWMCVWLCLSIALLLVRFSSNRAEPCYIVKRCSNAFISSVIVYSRFETQLQKIMCCCIMFYSKEMLNCFYILSWCLHYVWVRVTQITCWICLEHFQVVLVCTWC